MACTCNWAPYSRDSLIARILIILAFVAAQLFFALVILNQLYKGSKPSVTSFYVLLALWIFFSILWIWSHIRTSWLDAGSLQHELERLGYLKDGNLQNLPPQIDGLPRCTKCSLPKPERTHHCSECGLCYFRFDHHCPVIGNCVALYNLKAFMLFLIYTFMLIIVFSVGCFLSSYYKHLLPPIILGVIGAFIFLIGLCVGCFGFSYLPAVCVNRTTLERIAGVPEDTFNVGAKENFRQIFGNSFFSWFIPTKPSISGFMWAGITDFNRPLDNQNQIKDQTVEPPDECDNTNTNNGDANNDQDEIEITNELSSKEAENSNNENHIDL
ncbi:hypothetical protein M9Y10_018847 [Tritrichomonas musculus]|uniref:Palmitoyltransferase n=1 Tax=Tritrichomonas musculus TaxID=1915356 RepID=A0ABR2HIX4_9EUKA